VPGRWKPLWCARAYDAWTCVGLAVRWSIEHRPVHELGRVADSAVEEGQDEHSRSEAAKRHAAKPSPKRQDPRPEGHDEAAAWCQGAACLRFKLRAKEPSRCLWFVGDLRLLRSAQQKVTQGWLASQDSGKVDSDFSTRGSRTRSTMQAWGRRRRLYEVLATIQTSSAVGGILHAIVDHRPPFHTTRSQRYRIRSDVSLRDDGAIITTILWTVTAAAGTAKDRAPARPGASLSPTPVTWGALTKDYDAPREDSAPVGMRSFEMGRGAPTHSAVATGGGALGAGPVGWTGRRTNRMRQRRQHIPGVVEVYVW